MPYLKKSPIQGQGPLLVLLHGYGGSNQHWAEITQHLSPHFRIFAPQLQHLLAGQGMNRFADHVRELARFLKENFPGEQINLMGSSYGGALAWALALQEPDMIGHVSLINPMPPEPLKYFRSLRFKLLCQFGVSARLMLMALHLPKGFRIMDKAAQVFQYDQRKSDRLVGRKLTLLAFFAAHFSKIVRSEQWAVWKLKFQRWQHPVMMVYDSYDPLFKSSAYEELSGSMKSENILILEKSGHVPMKRHAKEISDKFLQFFMGERQSVAISNRRQKAA